MSKEVLSDLSVKGTLSIPKTGGGEMNVQQEIEGKQATLSFDSTPTASSTNPVTSGGVKTALDAKQNTITGGATTIVTSNLTASRALVSDGSGKVAVSAVTSTELGYLDGVTSAVQTQLNSKASDTNLTAHTGRTDNPHSVTKAQVGLSNVDNTSDTAKPISTATQTALNTKQDKLTFDSTPVSGSSNPVKSGGVYTELEKKADLVNTPQKGDSVVVSPFCIVTNIGNGVWRQCEYNDYSNFVIAMVNHQQMYADISANKTNIVPVCRSKDINNGDGETTHTFIVPANWWYRVSVPDGRTCDVVEQPLKL